MTDRESYARFRENVDVVLRAWTDERLTFHGSYWDFDDVEVLPKPLQQPHPPVWLASSSPDAIALVGLARSLDPDGPPLDPRGDRPQARPLRGASPSPPATGPAAQAPPMARLLAVAPTDAEAEEVARNGATWTVTAYANPGKRSIVSPRLHRGRPLQATRSIRWSRYVDEVIIWGSPSRVADKLAKLRETIDLRLPDDTPPSATRRFYALHQTGPPQGPVAPPARRSPRRQIHRRARLSLTRAASNTHRRTSPRYFHYRRSVIRLSVVSAPLFDTAVCGWSPPRTARPILTRGGPRRRRPGACTRSDGPQRLRQVDAGPDAGRQPRVPGCRWPGSSCTATTSRLGPRPAGQGRGVPRLPVPRPSPGVSVTNFLRQALCPQGRRPLRARGWPLPWWSG